MARNQLFESDVAASPRIELFFDDSQPAGESGFEVDYVSAANSVVETVKLTDANISLMRAVWSNRVNKHIPLVGGAGTDSGAVDTHWASFTRDNRSVWNVLEGATPEYAELTVDQTSQFMAWLFCGDTNANPV